jgi:hypothetical protein
LLAALVFATPLVVHAGLTVEWSDGLLSVAAEASPRSEVLHEVARQAEIEIAGLEAVGDDAVTMRLTRVSPLEAVQRLVKDLPVVLVEERVADGSIRLASVRLYAQRAPGFGGWESEEVGGDGDSTSGDHREALERSESESRPLLAVLLGDDDEQADAAREVLEARNPTWMIRELLVAAQSDVADRRLQAIRLLERTARIDNATAVAALDHALADDDDTVKTFAIGALSMRGAEGLESLRRAFRSSNRDVRLMVLEAVSERDRDSMLLREGLDDVDPQVRQFAAFRLSHADTPEGE